MKRLTVILSYVLLVGTLPAAIAQAQSVPLPVNLTATPGDNLVPARDVDRAMTVRWNLPSGTNLRNIESYEVAWVKKPADGSIPADDQWRTERTDNGHTVYKVVPGGDRVSGDGVEILEASTTYLVRVRSVITGRGVRWTEPIELQTSDEITLSITPTEYTSFQGCFIRIYGQLSGLLSASIPIDLTITTGENITDGSNSYTAENDDLSTLSKEYSILAEELQFSGGVRTVADIDIDDETFYIEYSTESKVAILNAGSVVTITDVENLRLGSCPIPVGFSPIVVPSNPNFRWAPHPTSIGLVQGDGNDWDTDRKITISWGPPQDELISVVGYQLRLRESEKDVWNSEITLSKDTFNYTFEGLKPNTEYDYQLRSVVVGVERSWAGYFDGSRINFSTAPKLSVGLIDNDLTLDEGEIGTIVVALSGKRSSTVAVDVVSEFGTAGSRDFRRFKKRVSFAPGERLKTFEVPTIEDSYIEGDERFTVKLVEPEISGDVNVITDVQAITIRDDDTNESVLNALSEVGSITTVGAGSAQSPPTVSSPTSPGGSVPLSSPSTLGGSVPQIPPTSGVSSGGSPNPMTAPLNSNSAGGEQGGVSIPGANSGNPTSNPGPVGSPTSPGGSVPLGSPPTVGGSVPQSPPSSLFPNTNRGQANQVNSPPSSYPTNLIFDPVGSSSPIPSVVTGTGVGGVSIGGVAPVQVEGELVGGGVSFSDTASSTHSANIEKLAELGTTRGCNPPANTRFCPDRAVTRGEMATFMVRTFDLAETSQSFFGDDDGSTHEVNINRLAAAGISQGCNPPANSHYCPDSSVTRAQMATFLARALQLSAGDGDFSDTYASVHSRDINRIASVGITRGCNPPTNTRFCPDRPVTRAEMATFLTRANNLSSG